MPRTAGVIIWTAGAVATHAVVPFELSRLGDRAKPQGPAASAGRGAGLLTVTAGAALMAWAMATHYQAAPRGWALDSRLTPGYLLRHGPYRLMFTIFSASGQIRSGSRTSFSAVLWHGRG